MKLAVVTLTRNAFRLGGRLSRQLQADLYAKPEFVAAVGQPGRAVYPIDQKFSDLVGTLFGSYQGLVFIMACGIVVRSITPYLQSKLRDPAIVVVDEQGRFAVSLAGGHLGGANQLAQQVASCLEGQAVITTATDLNQVVAFDLFARDQDCAIENYAVLKRISAALVNGERVGWFTDCRLATAPPPPLSTGRSAGPEKYAVVFSNSTAIRPKAEHTLVIRPRNLIVGLGCKKGTTADWIGECLTDFMAQNQKSDLAIKALVSIDRKAAEPGIVAWCQGKNLPFITVTAEEIQQVEGPLAFSPFVQENLGVGGVAEPCALLGGVNTRLICPKTVYPGLTLALAEEEKVFYL